MKSSKKRLAELERRRTLCKKEGEQEQKKYGNLFKNALKYGGWNKP